MNPTERTYHPSDVKELMANTGGWARNWDDVLRYLENPSAKDAVLSKKEVPQLIEDVRHLKEDNMNFTTDYRKVWQELTGERPADVLSQERDAAGIDQLAADSDGIASAGTDTASSRVLDILQRVQSAEYREMAGLGPVGTVRLNHK